MNNANSRRGERFFVNFSIIHRHSVRLLVSKCRENNIEDVLPPVLMLIASNEGSTQDFVAKSLGIDKGAIAKGIQKQINCGYIEKVQDPKDKRAYNLYTTPKGRSVIPSLYKVEKELGSLITESLTTEETKELNRLLKKMTNHIMEGRK